MIEIVTFISSRYCHMLYVFENKLLSPFLMIQAFFSKSPQQIFTTLSLAVGNPVKSGEEMSWSVPDKE